MKTVDFFGTSVSRLIMGDNPFNGHSYVPEIYDGEEMMDYYTAENAVKALFEAENNGITACMPLATDYMLRVLRDYRNQGGRMDIVFQPYPAIDLKINVRMMMAMDPIAIYHQGTTTDNLNEGGDIEKLRENIKILRDSGLPVGLGTHVPETVARSEEEDWGVDFYSTCFCNARRGDEGRQSGFITGETKKLVFRIEDRHDMFDVVQSVKKPFILYKLFAGGQIFYDKDEAQVRAAIYDAFKEADERIKDTDLLCVGVYQKYKNQMKENVDIFKSTYA
ncbi:MAG: hypothetical protein HN948_09870 [Clostridia bacterium]|nr:hypothetical protein [Clostridia bacterium]MBT7123300.1 hypothetical protein [Clostridia bacterium]